MRWNQLPAHAPAPISLRRIQHRSYQHIYHRFYHLLLLVCFSLFLPKLASATQLEFTIDTSALTGSGAVFAFDLVGGGDSVNSLVISGLQAPASASSGPSTGNVSGSFPSVTLNTDGSFFNEAQLIVPTLGTLITFRVDTTGIAPSNGGTPDAFSLFLLDPSGSQTLFGTSDPTGANALFLLNIGPDGGNLALYEAENGLVKISVHPVISSPVPEPASLAMLLTGLLLMLALTPAGAAVRRRAGVALFSSVLALAASGTAHAQTQVQDALDGKISIVKSGLVLNRVTNTYDGTLTIKNISASLISAPLTVTIKDISAAGVSVYNKSASDADGNAQLAASLALGLLKPGATVTVPVKFLNKKPAAFSYSVAVTGALLDNSNSATLQVKVLNFSGDDDHPAGSPAGAGISLVIGGQVRGVTDANGVATFPVPADTTSLLARRAPTTTGTAQLDLTAGATKSVQVVVSDDGEVYADAGLRIDQVKELLLPNDFSAFSLRFLTPAEGTVKLVDLATVELFDVTDTSLGDITSNFTLGTDGVIRPVNLAALKNLFAAHPGKLTLTATALDADGTVYRNSGSFYLSRNKVSIKLSAPASFPGLQLGGIRLIGKVLNTDITVSSLSDAQGNLELPDLPNGNLSISAQTFQNGLYYYGTGVFSLTGAANLNVTLLSTQDSASAGANLTAEPASFAASALAAEKTAGVNQRYPQDLQAAENTAQPLSKKALAESTTAAQSASVSVIAGSQNVPSTKTVTLTLPKGAAKLSLSYNVASQEYPTYVTAQSIYNDVWGIKVFAGAQGTQLFDITRQVNSQLTQAPVWLSNGTTGPIEQTFDVSAYTKTADAKVTLTAFATNIGDSILPTSVNATVSADAKLTINSVTPVADSWVANNNKTYYSIPATGAMNEFHRKVLINFSKPDDAKIDKVKVELLDAGGDAVVLDEAVGSNVTLVGDDEVRVVTTFKTNSSTVNGVPPPTALTRYRYTLTAKTNDGATLTATEIVTGKRALWHMPAGLDRYSTREPGDDDWSSKRTYEWIAAHTNLLRAINDISGEHGKDLGHASHGKGSDIDMYHFYRFPGASAASGTSNYNVLVARILDLPKQNSTNPATHAQGVAAANQVRAWITASRAGIDALAAETNVQQIGYIRGGPNAAGITGANFGETLLTTGRVTVNGTAYDLGTGAWTNAKYHAWANHHHHIHITLNPAD